MPIQRYPWRSPLWIALNLLPVALAAITIKVFGAASVALVRTSLLAPPAERGADLGLALIVLVTVGITAVVGVVFHRSLCAPGWRHPPGDTFEIHPDRLVVVDHRVRRELPWSTLVGPPRATAPDPTTRRPFLPDRTVEIPVDGAEPVRIPGGHVHHHEIVAAIARARSTANAGG
ncbi:MAG: hypothetical protein ACKO5K_08155 [Armatimonadota bacterium]